MSDTTAGYRPPEGPSSDAELEGLLEEMVHDWTSGTPRPLRAYLDGRPGLIGRGGVLIELINQEIILRRQRGETPGPGDYLAEFPGLTESLERLFDVHALGSATLGPVDGTMMLSPSAGPVVPRRAVDRLPEIPGYRAERVLGRGGMGVVYLARHESLNRRVALKLLQESRRDDPEHVARFRREAAAAARCQHPNLVQIHDIGEHDGEPYLALEYVAGGNLSRALAGKPRPPREAAELVETLARAIDHAHAQGVVHRDLKPANILLTPDGQPKITDFGLAKLRDSTTETQLGTVLGTLAYMAPEQVRADAGEIGPRTDIHALGILLYEALTGRPPYRAETPEQVLHAILSEHVEAPSIRRPGLPRDLEAICLKCLEKGPARRYATAADLAEDLRRFLDGRPTLARPSSLAERGLRWCRDNPGAVAAIGALLLTTTLGFWQAARAQKAEQAARTDRDRAIDAERIARLERDRAEDEAAIARAVGAFLAEDILGGGRGNPFLDGWSDTDLTVENALDLAGEKIGGRFADRPLVEASIRQTIGEAYRRLGEFDSERRATGKSRPQLERAIELRTRILGADDPQTLIARCRLGFLLLDSNPEEAGPLLASALDGLRASRGPADPETLVAMSGMGAIRIKRDQHDAGRRLLADSVEGLRAALGPADPRTLDATQFLVVAVRALDGIEPAIRLIEQSIRRLDEPVGRETRVALDARFYLATLLQGIDGPRRAIPHLDALLRIQRRLLGDDYYDTLRTLVVLAHYHSADGNPAMAEPLLTEGLTRCRKKFTRSSSFLSLMLADLAALDFAKGDVESGRGHLVEAVDITRFVRGADSGWSTGGNRVIASLYLMTGEAAAERYLRDLLAYIAQKAPDDPERFIVEGDLGYCLLTRKRRDEGDRRVRIAYEQLAPRIGDLPPGKLWDARACVDRVLRYYQEAGDRERTAIWKQHRSEIYFPTDGGLADGG